MKIISWNCNMAFRKKAEYILRHNPDILIVPECEHPEKLKFPDQTLKPTATLWFGENKNKGLGIFSFSNHKFKVLKNHNPELKQIIPIKVTGGKFDFILFAIWANNPNDPDGTYVEQIWKALAYYEKTLSKSPVILMGDFNSNTIWDRPRRSGNHSAVVKVLEERKIISTYHSHFKQIQGKEIHPTLYMYRHKNKPYHIDYCFASKKIVSTLQSVEIGEYEKWCEYSDHVPVIVTFK